MKPHHALQLCAAAALLATSARAQELPLLDLLVERLGTYLTEYESALGLLVADEQYEQYETRRSVRGILDARNSRRRLDSEVTFLRLPGGAEWFGIRDVRKVDGKAVTGAWVSFVDLLKTPGADVAARALAIVEASSKHNLGGQRTINMPTVPLEALSVQNHPRFVFKVRGRDRVNGVETQRLDFEEFDEPTLVRGPEQQPLWSRGSAWIEPDTGRLWKAELIVGPTKPGVFRNPNLESKVRVEFTYDASLGLLVPKELVEDFWIPRGRGGGKARYSNYRRFSTSARIVP